MDKKTFTDNMINQIFEQSGIIAYVDAAGRYVYVNSIWEREPGISRKHAIGKSAVYAVDYRQGNLIYYEISSDNG